MAELSPPVCIEKFSGGRGDKYVVRRNEAAAEPKLFGDLHFNVREERQRAW